MADAFFVGMALMAEDDDILDDSQSNSKDIENNIFQ